MHVLVNLKYRSYCWMPDLENLFLMGLPTHPAHNVYHGEPMPTLRTSKAEQFREYVNVLVGKLQKCWYLERS